MGRLSLQHKLYLILIILLAALAASCIWLSPSDTSHHRVEIEPPKRKDPVASLPQASLRPGKEVVVLQTSKGAIEFVLYEEDCPRTTKLIKQWVRGGELDGLAFARFEKTGLIQTSPCSENISPPKPELRQSLVHETGAVGMGKWKLQKEACGEIYILTEPWHHLDFKFVVFGRVINGLDIAEKLRVGDIIRKATLRPLTNKDQRALARLLFLDAERRTL